MFTICSTRPLDLPDSDDFSGHLFFIIPEDRFYFLSVNESGRWKDPSGPRLVASPPMSPSFFSPVPCFFVILCISFLIFFLLFPLIRIERKRRKWGVWKENKETINTKFLDLSFPPAFLPLHSITSHHLSVPFSHYSWKLWRVSFLKIECPRPPFCLLLFLVPITYPIFPSLIDHLPPICTSLNIPCALGQVESCVGGAASWTALLWVQEQDHHRYPRWRRWPRDHEVHPWYSSSPLSIKLTFALFNWASSI